MILIDLKNTILVNKTYSIKKILLIKYYIPVQLIKIINRSYYIVSFRYVLFLILRDGQAIWMDENIRFGKTDRCSTFNNPPLCASGDFEIRVLEVYGFAGA